MSTALLSLLVLFVIVLLWLDGARARELACAVVGELCQRRGYQLLDETVALTRLGLVRTPGGLRLRRLFRFDYSVEGVGRQQGRILLHGSDVANVDLREPTTDAPYPVAAPDGRDADKEKGDDNVIPFRRRH
jgi:hypothetical protein